MNVHFNVNIKKVFAVAVLALAGFMVGFIADQKVNPPHVYAPITFVSVGVVTNTLPQVVDEPALYVGDTLHYTSALCLNDNESVRIRLDGYWREFTPTVDNKADPSLTDVELNWPAGCTRKTDNTLKLPTFVTPGEWAFEANLTVLKGASTAQVTKFATTRFMVLPRPTGGPP